LSFWDELRDPSPEFSVMPFWFWNDDLDAAEIVRQIEDFQDHGVHGFVIHPRVGLPRSLGWMSDELLHFYDIAIAEAERRGMVVILYDEGMYPSGSSAGQVVAENPRFQTRCLDKIDLAAGEDLPSLPPEQTLVAVVERGNGSRMAVIARPLDAFIRGIHYIGDGPAEDEPPAADLLNPDAVAAFIRLVYDGFAARFSQHFGKTILAIFTDEPSPVGRPRERGIWPGTTGILAHVNRILSYDFTPHLPALWYDDEADAERYRRDYERAIALHMEESWYKQLFDWCEAHGLPLTGHPARGDDLGAERYFHIPGQDLVWRWVLPDDPTALEGAESTQGKCSSSAMIHLGRRRNTNECCGAYGHELTWAEMNWLADWCFVRGVNQIIPHAFYYSVRGIRRDERPPDVGPNSPWWDRFPEYADRCRRLSWLNTDAAHVCQIAILGAADYLPWEPAKVCFQQQRDFNYLEERHLWEDAIIDEDGVDLVGIHYAAVIVAHDPDPRAIPALERLAAAGRLIRYPADDLIARIDALTWPDVIVDPPSPALRVRHLIKDGRHVYLLFNEERHPLTFSINLSADGSPLRFDATTGQTTPVDLDHLSLDGYELMVVVVEMMG
jgi:hypothetical protein